MALVLESPYGWYECEEDAALAVCGCCHGHGGGRDEDGAHSCGWCDGRGVVPAVELDALMGAAEVEEEPPMLEMAA